MKYFEDFVVGETFITPGRTITDADIRDFAGVSGDFHSLHTDEEFAKRNMYHKRVAHGVLTLAIAEGLWMRLGIFEESLVAFYGIDELRFTKPVFIGDTIKATLTVGETREKRDLGLVTLKNEVTNQNGEIVLKFDAHLLFKRRGRELETSKKGVGPVTQGSSNGDGQLRQSEGNKIELLQE
jgi:3-hydroxybutyryl-CoA dehydratase